MTEKLSNKGEKDSSEIKQELSALEKAVHKEQQETTETPTKLLVNLMDKIETLALEDHNTPSGSLVLKKDNQEFELFVGWRSGRYLYLKVTAANGEEKKHFRLGISNNEGVGMYDFLSDNPNKEQKVSSAELKAFIAEAESFLKQYEAEKKKSQKAPSIFN